MRLRFEMRIYGYVVYPNTFMGWSVNRLQNLWLGTMHFLRLSLTKRLRQMGSFWQKHYKIRN